MGCLLVVAAALAFAIPASVAVKSLVGAYVVLALLVAGALAVALRRGRRAPGTGSGPAPAAGRPRGVTAICVVAIVYAAAIALIHLGAS